MPIIALINQLTLNSKCLMLNRKKIYNVYGFRNVLLEKLVPCKHTRFWNCSSFIYTIILNSIGYYILTLSKYKLDSIFH